LNLNDLVVHDPKSYVQLAVKIAGEPAYRANLMQRIVTAAATMFFDQSSAARELEDCLLTLGWKGER
jgi:predicted O-linked N-acetylglucosamine transferase (SPINDLY family)